MTDERPTLETPPPATPPGPPDVASEADPLPPAEAEAVDDAPPDEADEEKDEGTPAEPSKKKWYVVKVQSAREESIRLAIENRVKREGLEEYFGQIVVPVEKVTEMVKGKRVVKERKLYPGYLMVEVEYNDRIL